MDTIRTDTWVISLPNDWEEKGTTEAGALYFESPDGEKAMYISTWNLEGNTELSQDVANSFKAIDIESLYKMEGYSWQIVGESIVHHETSTILVVDSLAQEQSYRIVSKILSAPPVVVRATFHDYGCSNYATSKTYFSPIIESLGFYVSAV
jgi:hypothetical protein